MYILGINISHHASISLLHDGEVVYYMEDDRYSGNKEEEWKYHDEKRCLGDIKNYTTHLDHIIFASWGKAGEHCDNDSDLIDSIIRDLSKYNLSFGKIHYEWEHHLYHACSAFYGSGFNESAALILDGGGVSFLDRKEGESMYYFTEGKYEVLKKVYYGWDALEVDYTNYKLNATDVMSSTISCGWIFNTLQGVLGLEPGKVMGLSSYGNSDRFDDDWFKYDNETETWITDNQKILNTYRTLAGDSKYTPYDDEPPNIERQAASDLAKKAQEETRDHTIRLIKQLLSKTKTKNIVLSGGYFLNCVNNYEYLKEFPDVNFYIDPVCHDGGISIGAAKFLWHHVLNKNHPSR